MTDFNKEIRPEDEEPSCSPEEVAEAFSNFLGVYKRFRTDNGLTKPVGNIFEICTSMTDKHGRICREIKHFERKDPKADWPQGVVESLCGYIVYSLMIMEHYKMDVKEGFYNELNSAIKQHSKIKLKPSKEA